MKLLKKSFLNQLTIFMGAITDFQHAKGLERTLSLLVWR